MNARPYLIPLACFLALRPGAIRADDAPPALHMPTPAVAPSMAPPPDAPTGNAHADVPGTGFDAQRYQDLWTKSPFAVASSEDAPESPDYSLVGIANIDGISYASVIDKQNQNQHYLVASDKPNNGLTLVSIHRGADPSDTTAVIQKNGESITLKLEAGSAPPPDGGLNLSGNVPPPPMPGTVAPQIPMPGATPFPNADPNLPGMAGRQGRPPIVRFHRFPIHLPPVPSPQSQPPQSLPPPPH